jgi:hypothetical protein
LPKAGVEDDFQIYYDQKPLKKERTDLVNETIASYQTVFRYGRKRNTKKIKN